MEAVQAWLVAWFVVAQVLVAAAVWRHKDRWGGGAFWIAALLAVNALATLLSLAGDLTGHWPTSFVARMVDRATNPLLLIVAAAPLMKRQWHFTFITAALATALTGIAGETFGSSWGPLVSEAPLLAAMVAAGVALARLAKNGDLASLRWVLLLGILGMRFVELGLHSFVGSVLLSPPPALWLTVVRIGSAASCLVGALWALPRAAPGASSSVTRIAVGFVLAGVGLGMVRLSVLSAVVPPLVFLSLGLIRPVVIYIATHAFEGRIRSAVPFWESGQGRTVAAAAISAVGLLFQRFVAPDNVSIALAFSAAFAFLSLPMFSLVQAVSRNAWERGEFGPQAGGREVTPPSLALAPNWQRLILALWCVHGSEPRAFDRTTPGLQAMTGCPHASVGAEIRRCNQRAAAIGQALGLSRVGGPLVERTWGNAEGVRSHRAAIYSLTASGVAVADGLRAKLGLGGFSGEALLPLLRPPEYRLDRLPILGSKLD